MTSYATTYAVPPFTRRSSADCPPTVPTLYSTTFTRMSYAFGVQVTPVSC
ncbi:hypothetical protein [Deinococcus pimensis]|nr:hypothetical protein [Deinococcus pimensis]